MILKFDGRVTNIQFDHFGEERVVFVSASSSPALYKGASVRAARLTITLTLNEFNKSHLVIGSDTSISVEI